MNKSLLCRTPTFGGRTELWLDDSCIYKGPWWCSVRTGWFCGGGEARGQRRLRRSKKNKNNKNPAYGVEAAFLTKGIIAWSRTVEVWDHMEGIWHRASWWGHLTGDVARKRWEKNWVQDQKGLYCSMGTLGFILTLCFLLKLETWFFFLKGENGAIGALLKSCRMYEDRLRVGQPWKEKN